MNKSGRHRGRIWSMVRKLAQRRTKLSAPDLVPPLTLAQAKNALSELHQKGELERLKKGIQWHFPRYSIYAKTDKLRPAHLTNQHL